MRFLKNGSLNDFSKQHARFLSIFTYQKVPQDLQIFSLPKKRSQDCRVLLFLVVQVEKKYGQVPFQAQHVQVNSPKGSIHVLKNFWSKLIMRIYNLGASSHGSLQFNKTCVSHPQSIGFYIPYTKNLYGFFLKKKKKT